MTLRDIFKFRDPPESDTSKPFLEHLEDLRWTIVKMALTLGIAMSVGLLFLVAAENHSLFLSRHAVARLGADMDGAAVLLVRDAIHDRLRPGFRIAGRRPRSGPVWISNLQIHGAHSSVRDRAHLYPGDHHHAHARHSDLDRAGAADVSAVRKLHLDCVADGAPCTETDRQLIACNIRLTILSSERLRFFSARRSARF